MYVLKGNAVSKAEGYVMRVLKQRVEVRKKAAEVKVILSKDVFSHKIDGRQLCTRAFVQMPATVSSIKHLISKWVIADWFSKMQRVHNWFAILNGRRKSVSLLISRQEVKNANSEENNPIIWIIYFSEI